jgi:hypothetical protein
MKYLEKLEEAKKKGRCWSGHKPKPGSVPYSKGSCVKEAYKLIGLAFIGEEGTDPMTKVRAAQNKEKIKSGSDADNHRAGQKRNYRREFLRSAASPKRQEYIDARRKAALAKLAARKDPKAQPGTATGNRLTRRANVTGQRRQQARQAYTSDHTSYQQIGDVLAEAIFGKTRSMIANRLDKFSRTQYKKGESDEASGKPKRAGMRGRAAHAAGKLAQKVRPKDED